MIQSRATTALALDAVVAGKATDEAYDVLRRAGWHELFTGVVYREEEYMSLAASTARQIVTQAKSDEIYEGEIPEDDASVIAAAEELVEMAEQAWASNVKGAEVEKILKLAASDGNGSEPDATTTEPETTPEPDPEPEASSSDDDETDDVVVPALFADIPENFQKMEPYEGYGDDRVRDITESINWYLTDPDADQTEDQQREILQNVWAYETSHKNRTNVLRFVLDAARKKGFVEAEAKPAPSEKTPPNATQSEPEQAAPEVPDEDAMSKLLDMVDNELRRERIDTPNPPTEEAPELPWRWSEISDQALQDMHMQYASFAYYKAYERSREDRIAFYCKDAADEISREMMLAYPKGKDFKVTVAEAEIESDSRVKRWRKAQRRHEAFANQARQEMESYSKLVEALSRLESMRHNSYERGRR